MVQRSSHHGITPAGERLAVEPVVWQQLPGFGLERIGLEGVVLAALLSAGVAEFDKKAFRSVEMIVEDKENNALFCLGRISCLRWMGARPLPERSPEECGSKSQQASAGKHEARPGKGSAFRSFRVGPQRRLNGLPDSFSISGLTGRRLRCADRERVRNLFVCLFASTANAKMCFCHNPVGALGKVVLDELFFC